MLTKSKLMHIHRANNVTMSCKATGSTGPISPFGLVFVPTYRTLATASSFRLSPGCLLQCGASRPCAVRHPCLLMDLTAQVPHLGGFHLSSFQASKQLRTRMQSVDIHGLHDCLLAFLLFLDMLFHGSENLSIERPIVLFCNLSHLFQQMSRKPDGESLDIIFHETIITPNCNYRQG